MGIVLGIFIFRKQISAILNKKKLCSAVLKKEVDVHMSKTGRKIFFI
jgi:uncharacterized protein YneF (UPF0154 family)